MAKTWTLDEIGKTKRVNGKTVDLTDEEREQLLIDWNNAEKEQEAMLEKETKKFVEKFKQSETHLAPEAKLPEGQLFYFTNNKFLNGPVVTHPQFNYK